MAGDDGWPPPSTRAAELIRRLAELTLEDIESLFEVVDRAVLDVVPERVLAEPTLGEAMMAANHANLRHWLGANVEAPGVRVAANLGVEVLELARDIVRRGFDDASLNGYRVGQNAALRFLVDQVFEVSDEIELVREVLEVASRSIFTFVDDTLAGIEEQIGREREALTRGTHAERLEAVNLILEGAPISEQRAASRLGYELGAVQRAAVVWTEGTAAGGLEEAADLFARGAGSVRPFTVVSGARSLWVWCSPGPEPREPRPRDLPDGVRLAIGPDGSGLEGFRRSHFGALATQRLMQRARHEVSVAAYPEIELVALVAADEQRAGEYAARTLGGLAGEGAGTLRETLHAYVRADLNAAAAARALYAHRNTVTNRLERARELLGVPLEGRSVEVGLALEIARWLRLPAPDEDGRSAA